MHRIVLTQLLERYFPVAREEQVFKEIILAFIKAHSDCFERTLASGHITASAWLLNKNKTHALLMHHAKLNNWFQLGGHCDGNPDVLAVALKEAQEESGIKYIEPISTDIFDIDVHIIPARGAEKEHYHYDIRFLLHVTSDEPAIQNSESKALVWVSKDPQALVTNNMSVIRMFNKWRVL